MAIRRSPREKLFDGFNITLMLFLMFVTLYPFWHVIMASFSDSNLLLPVSYTHLVDDPSFH